MSPVEMLRVVLRPTKLTKKLLKVLLAFICALCYVEIANQLFRAFELNNVIVLILIGMALIIVWFYSKLESYFVETISSILPRIYQPKWTIKMIDFLLKCGYNILLVALGEDLLSSTLLLSLSHPVFNQEIYMISLVFTTSVAILGYLLEVYFLMFKRITDIS